jgi:ADP-ribosylglycohydrolase
VFLVVRSGASKIAIRDEIARRFDYDLNRRIDEIRPHYQWDVTCQGSVPEAILAFLESTDVESAIRLAISLGGDADTQATIAGGIAHAFYGDMPPAIVERVKGHLPAEFVDVVDEFGHRFMSSGRPDMSSEL